MGASLSVKLAQLGVNEASRTAEVSVEVIVTSTSGTHNHYTDAARGATFYLTLNGSTQSHVATFGSGDNGTFTTTLYMGSFTVQYNSSGTRTVTASARLITGTSAGTITGSDSLTLTPISSAGGSGGSGGGDNSEEYTGTTIVPSTGGQTLVPGNATIQGQYGREIMYSSWDGPAIIGHDSHPTYGSIVSEVAVICFTTPKFTGSPKTVKVALETKSASNVTGLQANIALCKSDSNRNNYVDAGAAVTDSNQIAVGSITLAGNSFCFTEIPAAGLESETEYYLILWAPNKSPVVNCQLAGYANHSINIECADLSVCYIANGSEYVAYQCFVDNGTGWDLCDMFADNGTSWDRITE